MSNTSCKKCGGADKKLVRIIIANGASHVFEQCISCGDNFNGSAIFLPHDNIGVKLEEIEVVKDYRSNNPRCFRCGALGTQEHHWAPQAFFNDANEWPKSHLCQKCHDLWHKIITPKICHITKNGKMFAKDLIIKSINRHKEYDVFWLRSPKKEETISNDEMLSLVEKTDVFEKTEHGYETLGWKVYAVIKESTGLFNKERMEYLFRPSILKKP